LKAPTKKKRKKTFRFRLFLFLFFLILAGIVGYYILSLPIWKIQEVVVSGANMLSAQEIRDLSGVPLSENLFLTSFSRVRTNLKKIAAIKNFHIYRIPPATVLIRITERKPIAVVILNDKSAIVDEEGVVLNRNPNLTLDVPNMTDLPVVYGVKNLAPKVSRLLADIVLELSSLLGSRRIQLELGSFEKISFLLDDMLRVKVGRDEDVKRKMKVFEALLPTMAGRWSQIEYVDVRFPDNPVIKYRE